MSDMQDLFGPGPSTRLPGFPDTLPSHPKRARKESMEDEYDYRVRVEQFDLTDAAAKAQYEQILTEIVYGNKLMRQEKWSSDKDGSVTIAMSWIDLIPKRRRRNGAKSQGSLAVHGSNPGLKDGEYPGQGAVIENGEVIHGADEQEEGDSEESNSSHEDM